MQYLLFRLKYQSAREASHHSFLLFVPGIAEQSKVLSFCFWCESGGMRKGDESKISFCHPRGVRASTQTYRERGSVISCVWSVCRWLSHWWLVFVLQGVGAVLSDGFDNTSTVSGKWNVSRVIPRNHQWVYKTLRFSETTTGVVLQEKVFLEILQIYRKTPVPGSLF